MKKVKALEVDGDWYIIPNEMYNQFNEDCEDEDLAESGEFDNKWGGYRTGGDLNLIQLWAEVIE